MKKKFTCHFEQLNWLLQDGRQFLVGNQFTAADLTLCSLAGILVHPKEYGYRYPELEQYPEAMRQQIELWQKSITGQYILNMYQKYRNQEDSHE